MPQPFIEFKDVSKSFGNLQVLDGVNLKIYSGEITSIIGKSGVGKSVLLKHIIGLLKPDSGQILIKGKPLSEFSRPEWREFKRSLSYMFQNNALFDSLTVFENIALPLVERTSLPGSEIKKKVDYRIHQFELNEVKDRYPSQISGGMQKRVALARALVTEPTMILFDEPTTGLDPLRKNAVLNMIAHYQHEIGFTGVMVSHDIPDVFFISNRVAIIENRKIPFQGTPLELEQSDDEIVWQFIHGQEVLQDQLTGLDPRPEVEKLFKELLSEVAAKKKTFSVALFTIDDLDEIKKHVGYIASQRIFQCMAMGIKGLLHSKEYAARFGSGEILSVFPDSGLDRAREVISGLSRGCSNQELMDPSKYKKVCIDFALKAGAIEVREPVDLTTLLEKLRENQEVIAKMECRGVADKK